MKILIPCKLSDSINRIAEQSYPEESAGFLLGNQQGSSRFVLQLLPLQNKSAAETRKNRYLIDAEQMIKAELEAEQSGFDLIGVFHSHPDHPAVPSEFDRQWALPWFSYLITSVRSGNCDHSRSWRLRDDRLSFEEEQIIIEDNSV
jgi:proteasome lid subunit RPN8/RPN11